MLRYIVGAFWALFIPWTIALSNVLLSLSYPLVFFWPSLYGKIARTIPSMLWPSLVWSLEVWSGNKLRFYGDLPNLEASAILLANHTYYCDFLIMFALALRSKMLAYYSMVLKGSLRYVPFVGTALSFIGFVFLSRSWETDKPKLLKAFGMLRNSSNGFWLGFHPEGTRITPKKLAESNQFAISKGMAETKYVLLPRVKGFMSALTALRDKPGYVVDMTIAYERRPANAIGFLAGLVGKPTTVHVYVRKFSFQSIPSAEPDITNWIYELYYEKDKLLQSFHTTGKFTSDAQQIFNNTTPNTWNVFFNIFMWYSLLFGTVALYYLSWMLIRSFF